MDQILVYLSLTILAGSMCWCIYSTIRHCFISNIKNLRYRYGVVISLVVYLVGELFFLIHQFNGVDQFTALLPNLFVFCTFSVTITIDTEILLIFRVLNPRIPTKSVKAIVGASWLLYITVMILNGFEYVVVTPNASINNISKIFRFLNAAWSAVYHNAVVCYLIYLVYTNLQKKSLPTVNIALKNSLGLMIGIIIVGVSAVLFYGYGLTLNEIHPYRLVFLNLANAGVGIQLNLLVYLFLFVTELQFSDKLHLFQ
jgi:hypothetical protein